MDDLHELKAALERERTARLAAEQKAEGLSIEVNRLNTIFLSLQSGMLVEDENRKILVINQPFCDMFSIPGDPQKMIGWDCSASAEQTKHLFADPAGFVERIGNLLTHRVQVLREEILLADGRTFLRDYIPFFLDGNYRGHLWNYRDVTYRKMAEVTLKNREERYRRIIENMNLGLLEVDINDRIRYANQSFCNMSGYSVEEMIGRQASELLMQEKEKAVIREKNKMRERGVSDAYEVQIVDRKGTKKWWLISGAPMYDDNCVLLGSVGIHLDITLQKELEYHLTEAKKMAEETAKAKEVFLANMSHEIRTPMNAIMGLGKQLLRTNLNPQQTSFLNAINTAADNLLVIINDILDFSKIQAGKMPLEKIGFDMKQLLKQVKRMLSLHARSKNLAFHLDSDPSIAPVLLGDPYRINQVVLNLLSNSIKFTEKGSVSLACKVVETSNGSQQLELVVRDTGIGMEKKFLNNIFTKFSQENVNSARKYGGTGLGMAITHQLVNMMNGTIGITSSKKNGTKVTIHLTLPMGVESDLPYKEKISFDPVRLKGKKLLLVEDNQLNRMVAKAILKRFDVIITEASNGEIAIDLMKTQTFDLVLMDMQMPVMDGLQATRILREELKIDTPIVALTANALKGEEDKCLEAGMNDFISKPFEEARLLEVLFQLLK
jgi:PAS domain S-box-containing protein